MADNRNTHPSQKRYPPELRERAVRMVQEAIEQTGERFGVITRVARQLGVGTESLRSWVAPSLRLDDEQGLVVRLAQLATFAASWPLATAQILTFVPAVDGTTHGSRQLGRFWAHEPAEESRRVKVREVIRLIEEDGWVLSRTRGSHRQYKHPTRPGLVTIPGKPAKDLPVGLQRSILRQAGLLGDQRQPFGAMPCPTPGHPVT